MGLPLPAGPRGPMDGWFSCGYHPHICALSSGHLLCAGLSAGALPRGSACFCGAQVVVRKR